jgi:hypothetical protein
MISLQTVDASYKYFTTLIQLHDIQEEKDCWKNKKLRTATEAEYKISNTFDVGKI